ncbi:CDP-glycerol glycerophosphotransferase family protein [Staphylococcus pragensis]|uniref:CDP-glycerol glycerophosphotransferase family protein n=1 Tax=Staphylococcus pragensis TaxID=1611836 RepID=A0A4Z1BKF9_9STAP|nr:MULTISPECIES: teichoic acid glycerol-phosphate primase TarB [Staphylococcus]RTX90524.1 CDP-glycerol glycerophosphotransferase family protein [Staphylococcus carnosus]TGN28097.1 CDP-glycerol glycerophosphotransferase family protein [Staphylococcus pragensis]GGG90060.1 teichoic acid biosynthesis protein B [Staphylococcus pragensis]
MRLIIKNIYMIMIAILNFIFKSKKVKNNHIVVMMTFPQDVLPIIQQLHHKGYHLTVIANEKEQERIKEFKSVSFLPAGNKHIFKHIKALSSAKVIIIDTYYLMLGGYAKKNGQSIIQTWHASGALKNFGLTDHQVDLNNKKMVKQYQRVYQATDYYLVGGEEMVTCFNEAFGATDKQMLRFGLPRLMNYLNFNLKTEQARLKEHYNITNKLAIYVPTYREDAKDNRQLDKANFETQLPNYTLINQLHPSISGHHSEISTSELMIMADVIISDYSSLPIEASLLNKPVIFYVYDEEKYEKVRGLNQFYKQIPQHYKVFSEKELIFKIKNSEDILQPLFKDWHRYNTSKSLQQIIEFIEKLVKE